MLPICKWTQDLQAIQPYELQPLKMDDANFLARFASVIGSGSSVKGSVAKKVASLRSYTPYYVYQREEEVRPVRYACIIEGKSAELNSTKGDINSR